MKTLKVEGVYAADLPAELQQGARSLQVRIPRITSGAVVIDVSLDAEPGEQLALRIAGIGRPIAARYAGAADPGSYLQLPMDLAHVDWVEGEIRQLGLRPAA